MGIEPTSQAWEARILPMNYTRIDRKDYSTGVWKMQGKSFEGLRRDSFSLGKACGIRRQQGQVWRENGCRQRLWDDDVSFLRTGNGRILLR